MGETLEDIDQKFQWVECLVDASKQIEDSVMSNKAEDLCYLEIKEIYEKIALEFVNLKDEKLNIDTNMENLSEYIYGFIECTFRQIFNQNQYVSNETLQNEFAEFYKLDDVLDKLNIKKIGRLTTANTKILRSFWNQLNFKIERYYKRILETYKFSEKGIFVLFTQMKEVCSRIFLQNQ